MNTVLLVTAMVLLLAPYANAARPVQQRIGWLQGRASHWRYVCRHGRHETRRYACQARVWTVRELREARAEKHARDWDWQTWLPARWQRIIRCETGSNFQHSNGTHQGAFGFAIRSWDDFKLPGYPAEAWQATPREQYQVALAIYRRYGLSGWGCRTA